MNPRLATPRVTTSQVTTTPTTPASPDRPSVPAVAEAGRARLTTFLDLSAQIFCITDFTGALVWWNPAFERTLGYRAEELRGLRLDDLVHPDDRAVRKAAEAVLAENGEAGLTQVRFCTRRGQWRWLEWTNRVDIGRQRVYGAARDVTERRHDEVALRESEARLRAIMKYSPSVIFVKDLEGRYLLVNDEFSRVAGVPVDAAVGLTAPECWPEDTNTIPGRRGQLIDDGLSFATDVTMTTVDGPRDFMVSHFLIRDEAGTPFAIGGIATDTTERHGAEKALAARDRLLDSVIGASPDMITLMDRAGKIHQISEAESALFGHRHEVFTRSDVFDFVHPDDFDDVASLFIRMVTGAISHLHLRYRARHAEGHWVTVDSRAQAVLDNEGHFAGAVVVSRDISDKLESEERLQTSRESAEKASKAKSDFLSRMSHELRTPLNSILGFAQLIQMDDIPGQQADAVDHILRAGRHLLDLIDEVLDIARIESGYLELTLAPVVVAEIVSEALELTNPIAARAEVVIRSARRPPRRARRHRRSPTVDAGPPQLVVQRREVQQARRSGRHRLCAGSWRPTPVGGGRHRERHPAPGLRPRLRSLRPPRARADRHRGNGGGSGPVETPLRAHGRRPLPGVGRRRGDHLHRRPPRIGSCCHRRRRRRWGQRDRREHGRRQRSGRRGLDPARRRARRWAARRSADHGRLGPIELGTRRGRRRRARRRGPGAHFASCSSRTT